MNLEHASRFASAQARLAAGDLYPDPWLLPRGFRRTLDALLAVAFGPARRGGEAFRDGSERALRGRPDGPLLLALWSAATAAEMRHADLRALFAAVHEPLPDPPASRAELRTSLQRRVEPLARCVLAILQAGEEALPPAVELGIGLGLARLLLDTPAQLRAGRLPWPEADLTACGLRREDLARGLPGPAVSAWLRGESSWALEHLARGHGLREHVGARLRRALDNEIRRARRLLAQASDPQRDLFRNPPRLPAAVRWSGRARALGNLAHSVLLPHS